MSENRKNTVEQLRCPLCLSHESETPLKYDDTHKEYFCTTCEYTGTANHVKQLYKEITSRFKLINTRIKFS